MDSHDEGLVRLNALLIDAIVRMAPEMVIRILEMGADVNHTFHLPVLKNVRFQLQADKSNVIGIPSPKSDARICSPFMDSNSKSYATPMHVAVIHLFLYRHRDSAKEAIEIMHMLMKYGANMKIKSTKMIVCNMHRLPTSQVGVVPPSTPFETAMYVKDMAQAPETFKHITDLLMSSYPDTLRPLVVPKMVMSTVVYKRWRAMLTECTFGDVTFVCADGEVVAHTSVLVHASEYFRRLFEGPWNDSNGNSLHLNVMAEVIRGILSHVYIGEIDMDVVARHAADFLRLSQEYFLSDLEALTDAHLAGIVTLENLETFLTLADLHDATKLKKSCFDFVCSNKATALSRMMHLANTHPDLWTQMVEIASANESAHKKQRAS